MGVTGDAGHPEPVAGLAFHRSYMEEPLMVGKHRLRNRQVQRTSRPRVVEVVDARTLTAHFLTLDAMAAGRLPQGRYIAVCDQDVLPASLVESGRTRCPSCVLLPSQRQGCHER
jgi:hypothetical protein